MKKREFKISFFLHVWEKKAEEISLEEFHNDLRGARWKVLAGSYRRWMQTGMAEEAKKAEGCPECSGGSRQVPGRTCGEPGEPAERTGTVRL